MDWDLSDDAIYQRALETAQRRAARQATRAEFAARRRAGKAAGNALRLKRAASTASALLAPPRHGQRWTAEEHRLLAALAGKGTPNPVIAQQLGRTPATIAARKTKYGLGNRPDHCQQCGAVLECSRFGRPRQLCPPCQAKAAKARAEAALSAEQAARAAARRAAIQARTDWSCAADECSVQLPRTNPARQFCSRACAEARYKASAQRSAQGRRFNERKKALRRASQTTVLDVVTVLDAARAPNNLTCEQTSIWIRQGAGLDAGSAVIAAAVKLRKARAGPQIG